MKKIIVDTVIALAPKGRHIKHPKERKWSSRIMLSCGIALCFLGSQMIKPVKAKGEAGRLKNHLIEQGIARGFVEPVYKNKLFFPKEKFPTLKGGSARQNEVIRYAYKISKSEDFVYTIMGENLQLTHDRKHNTPYYLCWDWNSWTRKIAPNQAENAWKCKKGMEGWFTRKHFDWGHGVGDGYHKIITDNPKFFTDWKWNLEQTFDLWNKGTKFYGESRKWIVSPMVLWTCPNSLCLDI